MTRNELHTVFPFYDSTDKQNHRKIQCDILDFCTFELITSKYRFLPWQIKRDMNVSQITEVLLWCADDSDSLDITSIIPATDIEYATVGGEDYITYFANEDLTSELECGHYYLEITDGTNIWFSEVFTVMEFTDDTIDTYRAWGDRTDSIRRIDSTDTDLRVID